MDENNPDPNGKPAPPKPRKTLGKEEFFDVFKSGGNSELFAKSNPKKNAIHSETRTGPTTINRITDGSGPTIQHASRDANGPTTINRITDGSGPTIQHASTDANGPTTINRMTDGSGPTIQHDFSNASGPTTANHISDGSGPTIQHDFSDASGPTTANHISDGSGPTIQHDSSDASGPTTAHHLTDGSGPTIRPSSYNAANGPSISRPLSDATGPSVKRSMTDVVGSTTTSGLKKISISSSPTNPPQKPAGSVHPSTATSPSENHQTAGQNVKLNSVNLSMSDRIAKMMSDQKETQSKLNDLEKDSLQLGQEKSTQAKPKK